MQEEAVRDGRSGLVIGLIILIAIVATGLAAIASSGGALFHLVSQAAGALAAVALAAALIRARRPAGQVTWAVVGLAALAGLFLVFLHPGAEGVHRWVALGPVLVQPAPIALPLILAAAMRLHAWAGGAIILAAALALALQPDGQATMGLALGVALLAWMRRKESVWWAALVVCLTAAVWAGTRPEVLVPVPYVEGVLESASGHRLFWLLALAALGGVPALIECAGGRSPRGSALAAMWLGFCMACLDQRFPVPVIGFGLSWVIGWGLSLGLAAQERRRSP